MSSSDETDDPIVDFKQPPRYTNLDYREKLSLRANEVSEMRVLVVVDALYWKCLLLLHYYWWLQMPH